jgi:hypothetical protein
MSEIRRSQPLKAIEVPQSEPLIRLSVILAGVGWLTYQTAKLAVKGAAAGSILAYKGTRALTNAIQESHALSLSQVDEVVAKSQTAGEALVTLSTTPGFDLPKAQAEVWKARIEKLAVTNDKLGVATMAREIVRTNQDRLQATLLTIASKSFQEIGFTPTPFRVEHGAIVGKGRDGRQSITVSVDKAKDGSVQLHFDAEGFHGGACIQALDALQRKMEADGVRFRISTRKRKEERPVFDGRRQSQMVHARKTR